MNTWAGSILYMMANKAIDGVANRFATRTPPLSREEAITRTLDTLAQIDASSPIEEEPPEAIVERPEGVIKVSEVSTEETIAYQNRELGKELLLLERHLQQGCRIPPVTGNPCDCCSPKHTITIEALALETYGMTGDLVYQEVAKWSKEIESKSTIEEIESGKHNYGEDAVTAREYRKRLLGTESLAALITPKPQMTLEEAKAEAARMAAEEIEVVAISPMTQRAGKVTERKNCPKCGAPLDKHGCCPQCGLCVL